MWSNTKRLPKVNVARLHPLVVNARIAWKIKTLPFKTYFINLFIFRSVGRNIKPLTDRKWLPGCSLPMPALGPF